MVESESSPLKTFDLKRILEKAKQAESQFDLDGLLEILKPVWTIIDNPPNVLSLPVLQQAEIYRLTGYALVFFGKSVGSSKTRKRGKGYLNKASKIFAELHDHDRLYLTQNLIATYYNEDSSFQKAEEITSKCEAYYQNNKSHYNYLYARISRITTLQCSRRFIPAKQIVETDYDLINRYSSIKVRALFNIQAGIVYRGLKMFEKAINHYQQVIECARLMENKRLTAVSKHLLAKVYKDQKNYQKALDVLDGALAVSCSLDDYGWLAIFSNTKAQLYSDMEELTKALSVINRSIFYFRSGDDYVGFTSALWSKLKILTKLNRYDEAQTQFEELIKLVSEKGDKSTVDFYTKSYKQKFCQPTKPPSQKSEYIYRLDYINSKKETCFLINENLAVQMYGVNEQLVVTTKSERLFAGEFAIFLHNNSYLCGQLVKKEGWRFKEILSLKDIPVEQVKLVRRIRGCSKLADLN